MAKSARGAAGCAVVVLLAIVMVIALVGWALTVIDDSNSLRQWHKVPEDVPPADAAAVPEIDVNTPGRTSDKLQFWAEPLAETTGIPAAALRAYGNAELIARQSYPECHLNWGTLAGIGFVETRHGSYSGQLFGSRSIDDQGYVLPPIVGVPLDGSPGFARVEDTDGGKLDGDNEFDRAVGPMQFIPESWSVYGRDANGDGVADPNQIDDAAASAANLLCTKGGDLDTPQGWAAAIRAYNQSEEYLRNVRNAAASYALEQRA
ncbi:lytic transglycosylase domain-containing protein [Corynebacterium pelargi]|uniref:Transglycosylase SLT domain-containing protein n=1 Tax=Corynebacterium pelargi TaxID=1471400 RepID=A0A410W9T1_9CORY|nr:lytic murein transglycosylase [Corynebacterium pelargi]QAU52723.1 hypothetical protein CPELA_07310 [Corynebacterium pelargi]GGG78373.1 hypothetical protein GCM10007338_15520 [Corynebacterium pelargi]